GDAARNVVATPLPAFTDYGHVVKRRLPFLIPFAALVVVVGWALRSREPRRPLLFLLGVAVLASAVGLYSLRPRIVLPGTALWFVAVCVALLFLLRRGALGPGPVAALAVVVAAISVAFGYAEATEAGRDYYRLLYSPTTGRSQTAAQLAGQRARY